MTQIANTQRTNFTSIQEAHILSLNEDNKEYFQKTN
jgi:hypothetical protein